MQSSSRFSFLLLLAFVLPRVATPTAADPVVAVHLEPRGTGSCSTVTSLPCEGYDTSGEVGVGYDLYIVGAGIPWPDGIAGIELGVSYGPSLSIPDRTLCSDLEFPGAGWPASGTGAILTFSGLQNCQQTHPGQNGAQAVFTSFYVYAYGDAEFNITGRPVTGKLALADCGSAEHPVAPSDAGSIVFSAGGSTAGYRPCEGPLPEPPRILSAVGYTGSAEIIVMFSEPVPNANYALFYEVFETVGGAPVAVVGAAFVGDQSTVRLDLASPLASATSYTVRVNGVTDAAGDLIAPDSTEEFVTGPDNDSPYLASVEGQAGDPVVLARFNEAVGEPAASDPANYTLTLFAGGPPNYTVTAVDWQQDRVYLTVDPPLVAGAHDLAVTNIEDLSGNGIAPGAHFRFTVDALPPGDVEGPKLGWHVGAYSSRNPCDVELPACEEFDVHGDVNLRYSVYLVVVDLQNFASGFAGVEYGLTTQENQLFREWTNCSDLEFPTSDWPNDGSGNISTWDQNNNCQQAVGPDGVRAVVGALYLYAYADDRLQLIPRPVSSRLAVASCQAVETVLSPSDAGAAGFGSWEGFNPCLGGGSTLGDGPTPVKNVTWGALKRLYADDPD